MLTSNYHRETLVERITYTASLVTRIRDVDPYLDKLRAITSRTDFLPEHMSDQQYSTLVGLQQQLEKYLIEREALRSFTSESLQIQIEQHLGGNHNAKRGLRQVAIILGVAAAAAVLVGVLPLLSRDTQQHIILAGAATSSIMNLGAAWLFLTALSAFKSQLRRAFALICIGIVLFGLSLLIQPLIELWNLRTTSDVTTLVVMPIVFLSAVFLYEGIRKYAVLAGVQSKLLRIKILFLLTIPLVVAAFIVHGSSAGTTKHVVVISLVLHALVVLLAIVSVVLLVKVMRGVADLYKPPVRALLQAIVVLMIGTLVFAGLIADAGPRLTSPMAVGLFAFLFIMGGMLVRAGYKFNEISRY